MIILSASGIGKSYGTDTILENISFSINAGDRVGIVGANGAGKSTLLNILSGEMSCDEGNFFVAKDTTIGYLKQKDNFDGKSIVIEEVQKIFKDIESTENEIKKLTVEIEEVTAKLGAESTEASKLIARLSDAQEKFRNIGGFSYKSEMYGILSSMAFGEEYYEKRIDTLSGGERTRLALACLLLEKPDILFLDEPTNHLDIGTLKWLEQYLKGYKGTIVLISHDRYFLDQTVNRVFEVENHKLTCYDGNYSEFADKKRALREAQMKAYTKQQTEIRRQEDMIRRYKERGTEKLAKRAASREKMLEHMERIDRPENLPSKMKISFHQKFQSGNDVLYGENLSKQFGFGANAKLLFENVNFDIKRGERICIVGPNGVGKTTLLRILMEELSQTSGYLKVGHNVEFGYYDQGQMLMNNEATVMDEVHDAYSLYKDSEIRGILGRFLFKNEQVFLKVGSLSGGEKARLALLKLMMSGANVLLLDEPTNHLDIESKEVFEEALLDYPGTVITVSHDRYFLNKIPTRILELEKDGFTEYLGKYDYYVEKKESVESGKKYLKDMSSGGETAKVSQSQGNVESAQGTKLSAAEERELKKKKEAEERRKAREKNRLEEEITSYEEQISELEAEMCKPEYFADHNKLAEMDAKLNELKEKLELSYESWMEL